MSNSIAITKKGANHGINDVPLCWRHAWVGDQCLWTDNEIAETLTAASIVDAKVDALLKHAEIEFDPFEQVNQEVIDAIKNGSKIEAIRLYKESSGVSLKEAKEYVEEFQRRAGLGG